MKLKSQVKNGSQVDSSIFDSFNKLTSEDESVRIKGASGIIKILEETDEEKLQKQLDYAIKRLVRGNGSSTSPSRIGFHTALTGLLNSSLKIPPKVSDVLEVLKKEFHGADDKGKVDSMVGTALVCGAIIRSEKALENISVEEVSELTKCLTSCLAKPSVASLAFSFLNELVIKTSTEIVTSTVWPGMKKNLSVAKDSIGLDQLYLLLVIEESHENVIEALFYKKFWQSEKILCADNFSTFLELLWKSKKTSAVNHPFYVYFARRLTSEKLVKPFWNFLDEFLASPTKQIELITIHTAIAVVKMLEDKPKEVLKIFTPNFMKMLKTNGMKSIRDEDVVEMYNELYDLLDQRFQALKNDAQKLQALRTFSGIFTVEKSSQKKFLSNLINSLTGDALNEVVSDVKAVIVSDNDDRERQYAATILQKIISGKKSAEVEWRVEQLKFLVNLAIFKSSDGVKVTTKEESVHSNAGNIKNIFYHCLECKLPKLEDEKAVLVGLVTHINEQIRRPATLQKPLSPSHLETWQKVFTEATKKADKKLRLVFQVLTLHMGLQLFNNPEVAANAIVELEAVTHRALQKKNSQSEPDWIEVVVDLFLTLLSQESHVLRNVIRHVFPQLCSQVTVTAFHQILSLLDLKSKENPLEAGAEEDSEEESEEEENSDDSDDSEVEEVEEKETINDSLRLAVQNALGTTAGDDDDIDLDDLDEEEGAKIDAALAEAFKMLKQNRKPKKTKADKIAEKTLLHFRMRALDLVEIYLRNNPQMEICLETLIFFYDLMPIAMRNDGILARFDGIFAQLAQLKSFSLETVSNVTPKHLAETLTNILDKTVKEKTNVQQMNHFARACVFLINCSQILLKLRPGEDEVLRIMLERLREFFTTRNPTLQITTFNRILATQWNGNFKMAKFVAEEGLKATVRSLRRTQSLQMLKTFFKNHHLMTQNEKQTGKYSEKISECLKVYASEVDEIPQPEFLELIQFILAMRNQKNFTAKDELVEAVAKKFRIKVQLKQNVLATYKTFCNVFKVPFVGNEKVEVKTNGVSKVNGMKDVEENGEVKENGGGVKRKKNSSKKEKKLKKQQRLEAASKGFNGGLNFSELMIE